MGARTGDTQLLLYSVFHLGNAANNISWASFEEVSSNKAVDWIVPLSLGDSHRQFRVVGTTDAFFDKYLYGRQKTLSFSSGKEFSKLFDVVVGSEVAATLGYEVGHEIVVSHGLESLVDHDDLPFRVSGVLTKTGTPVDRSLFISLDALEAIHTDVGHLRAENGSEKSAEELFREVDLTPNVVTAALIGVRDKIQIFSLQRQINEYPTEPLTAILPGVTLSELWRVTGLAENVLLLLAWSVAFTAFAGMMATVMAGLTARQREFAIFRTIGAAPKQIVTLVMLEVLMLVAAATVVSFLFASVILAFAGPLAQEHFSFALPLFSFETVPLQTMAILLLIAPIAAILPAAVTYTSALSSQLAHKDP
jgi:putative ABC transport system permease protein